MTSMTDNIWQWHDSRARDMIISACVLLGSTFCFVNELPIPWDLSESFKRSSEVNITNLDWFYESFEILWGINVNYAGK